MLPNNLNQTAKTSGVGVSHQDVLGDRSAEVNDEHRELDLSLSLGGVYNNKRRGENHGSPSPIVMPIASPNRHVRTRNGPKVGSERRTFLRGRARARIDGKRRAAAVMKGESGLPPAYLPTWNIATATVAVNSSGRHGRVLNHAETLRRSTGKKVMQGTGSNARVPLPTEGTVNTLPIRPLLRLNDHPAQFVLNPIPSNTPKFSHSMIVSDLGVQGIKENLLVVTTTGNGPNGRKIDGVVFKCGKFGEIIIVCDCHGLFLTSAGFVEHAGGTNLGDPMKKIIACITPAPF